MLNALSNLFIAPQFIALTAIVPLIVLLYILKLRRTEVVIPSTYLWIKSLHDLTANAPFQRLRRNLLLLLQILVTLLIVLALMRPFLRAEAIEGQSIALVLDASASMQTRENGGTRLDLAKARALEMIDAMAGGDRMMVISFSKSADVLCELTADRGLLRRAVESTEATDTPTNIRDVILIASSLAPDNPDMPAVIGDLELVLFSDGNISDLDAVGARAPNLTYVKVGESTANAGIVHFSVRKPVEPGAPQQTFVLVRNADTKPLDTTLTLYFGDSVVAVEEVHAEASSEAEAVFEHPEYGQGILRAELDRPDALDADNRAWLALQPSSRVRTLVVTNSESTSGYYIKRALALEPRVDLQSIEPSQYLATDDYDLTIFDGYAPVNKAGEPDIDALPPGASVFFDALPPLTGLTQDGDIEFPPVLSTDHDHPATRFLNPGNLSIRTARRLVLPGGSRSLMTTTGSALIADLSRGGRQILVVGFDVANSNWPLRLSFPLFMQNIVSWTSRSALDAQISIPTGDPIALVPPDSAGPNALKAVVTDPAGTAAEIDLDPARPVFFAATRRAGIYTVQRGDASHKVAVNLLDRNETAIAPAESIAFGRTEVIAEHRNVLQTIELWRWFLLAAFCILLAEWWIYSRRAWA